MKTLKKIVAVLISLFLVLPLSAVEKNSIIECNESEVEMIADFNEIENTMKPHGMAELRSAEKEIFWGLLLSIAGVITYWHGTAIVEEKKKSLEPTYQLTVLPDGTYIKQVVYTEFEDIKYKKRSDGEEIMGGILALTGFGLLIDGTNEYNKICYQYKFK